VSDTYRLLRFGVFELNLDLEEIRKNGTSLKLPPQPFKLLALLASRSGQVVTRDEIQQQLWGSDTFIDFEQGVNKCIKQIRTALSDNADNPLYLETVPRRGYRFLAPVRTKTVPAPPPQVREASSALLTDVSAQVRARVEAASQVPPAVPQQPVAESVPAPADQPASVPPPSPQGNRSRLIGSLVGLGAIIAVVLYWFLSHGMR
jgi:DNA-binding winged helix-turn-helix (wHTH) protein